MQKQKHKFEIFKFIELLEIMGVQEEKALLTVDLVLKAHEKFK